MTTSSTKSDPLSLRRRLQVLAGLALYGVAAAVMVRSGLGLDPWSVLHQGLAEVLPLSFGAASAMTGAVVLLALRSLGARPGVVAWTGLVVAAIAADLTLAVVPEPGLRDIEIRCAMLVAAVLAMGMATAFSVGAGLSNGPREGLSNALVERTPLSSVQARTAVEGSVAGMGLALGGVVNFGTVLAVLAIGPVARFLLPRFRVEDAPRGEHAASTVASHRPTPLLVVEQHAELPRRRRSSGVRPRTPTRR